MSHPLASLFGGGSSQTNPMLAISQAAPPPVPQPASAPQGSPTSIAPTRNAPSFMSSAAPAAATGQTASKTLLGQ